MTRLSKWQSVRKKFHGTIKGGVADVVMSDSDSVLMERIVSATKEAWKYTPCKAGEFQDILQFLLEESGCMVQREARSCSNLYGNKGRVDLCVWYGDESAAIELDRISVRKNSSFKLLNSTLQHKVAILREKTRGKRRGFVPGIRVLFRN